MQLTQKQLARLLEGYSGSDMRNLCTAAAYQPIRELIAKEDMVEILQTEGLEGMRSLKLFGEISAAVDSPRPESQTRCVCMFAIVAECECVCVWQSVRDFVCLCLAWATV